MGSKAFGGLNRRLKEKTAESRWFETTGQAPFGRAKAAYWKIKIDVLAAGRTTVAEQVELLRHYGVQLLAEKVETQEDFTYYKTLGFEYFQGYFFCRPDVIRGQRSPTNRLGILELLAKLQSSETSFRELEALLSRDVSLSYKVLRAANAMIYTGARKVSSVHQALQLVGLTAMTNIVSLFLLANLDDKPHELLITAMVRAKMCEQLARFMQQANSATFFTVGLLSVLDSFLDRPMADILPELPLADDIIEALLAHTGVLGATLRCVLAYERGDWEVVQTCGCRRDLLVKTYLDAFTWATEMQPTLYVSPERHR